MEFRKFVVKNFKGVQCLEIDLDSKPSSSVFTLVGLNESGKTTILEALSFFNSTDRAHQALYEKEYKLEYNQLVPLKEKSNFNEKISVSATISLTEDDKIRIVEFSKKEFDFKINKNDIGDQFVLEKELTFEKSVYKSTMNLWSIDLIGTFGQQRKKRKLYDTSRDDWEKLVSYVKKKIPTILFFPTFLFDFPNKIFLTEDNEESELNKFYRLTIQDILDSIEGDLSINNHIVDRALSGERHQERSLNSLLHKMGIELSNTIFNKWNEIFEKKIPAKIIDIKYGIDGDSENSPVYLEFDIVDGDSLYLLSERSLGFRWFFCFLLFTQYRSHRKVNNGTFFLLDEPASNLHSKAQSQLLNSFGKITEQNCKIMYSTHSHYMINPVWLESTFIVQNLGLDYDEEFQQNRQETNIVLKKYRDFVGQNPDKETYFKPILDAIDYIPSKLDHIPNVIMVEGKNDFFTIKYFELLIRGEDRLKILPGTGATDLNSLIALYKAWGRKFCILFDNDSAGINAKNDYQNDWLIDKSSLYTLGDVDNSWLNFKLENLIEKEDRKLLVPDSNRITKKQLNRAIQENLASNKEIDFSIVTKENFSKLLGFLDTLSLKMNED